MLTIIKKQAKRLSNYHFPGNDNNIFLFSSPRSGSTWLMELILTQPGFKPCNEPFDLRIPRVREQLQKFGIFDWGDYHNENSHQKIEKYINELLRGKINIATPSPHKYYFRLITNKIIFKILHAAEDKVEWFSNTFNGHVLFLVRHPIPVSLSRTECPRLDTFLNTKYIENFSKELIYYSKKLRKSGNRLELLVLDWCLQNAIHLQSKKKKRALVFYENLVLNPKPVIETLSKKLCLLYPHRMYKRLGVASRTTNQSDEQTKKVLNLGRNQNINKWLVEKWKDKINIDQEKKLMEIVENFGISQYQLGSTTPCE